MIKNQVKVVYLCILVQNEYIFFIRMVSQLYFYHLEYYLRKFCFKQNKTISCNFFLRIVPICNTQIVVDTYQIVPIHLWYSSSCRYLSNCPHPSVILNQLSILIELSPPICDTQPVVDTCRLLIQLSILFVFSNLWSSASCRYFSCERSSLFSRSLITWS